MTLTPSEIPAAEIDLFDDDVLADSHPVYARLREMAPAVHLPGRGIHAITRYENVRKALGDPATFSSRGVAFNPTMNEMLVGTSLATDPPEHAELRAVLTENLTPRAVRRMGEGIRAKADALLEELLARESFDGMEDLAKPYVTSIVMDLIGIRDDVREKILTWGEAAFNMQGPDNERMRAALPIAGELFHWTHEMLAAEDLAEGSIGRAVFEAGERGDIPRNQCGAIVHQYIAAGQDTTITAIGNAVSLLGSHPAQFGILRDDPSLVPSAFAEVQRFLPPVPVVGRLVVQDAEIDGHVVPAGSQAALLVAAGNRDPRHYEDPETFDVTRNPVDHLSFGYGAHGCAGQGLARLEAHSMISALADKLESFDVTHTSRRLNNITRPFEQIAVTNLRRA